MGLWLEMEYLIKDFCMNINPGSRADEKDSCWCVQRVGNTVSTCSSLTWDNIFKILSLPFKSGAQGNIPGEGNKGEEFSEICNHFILEVYFHFFSWVLNFGLSHKHCSDFPLNLHPHKSFLCSYIFLLLYYALNYISSPF